MARARVGKRTQTMGTKPLEARKPSLVDDTVTTSGDYLRPGDAQAEFDSLVAEHMAKNPGMSRGKATEKVMATSGRDAYQRAKTERLRKAAALTGS